MTGAPPTPTRSPRRASVPSLGCTKGGGGSKGMRNTAACVHQISEPLEKAVARALARAVVGWRWDWMGIDRPISDRSTPTVCGGLVHWQCDRHAKSIGGVWFGVGSSGWQVCRTHTHSHPMPAIHHRPSIPSFIPSFHLNPPQSTQTATKRQSRHGGRERVRRGTGLAGAAPAPVERRWDGGQRHRGGGRAAGAD